MWLYSVAQQHKLLLVWTRRLQKSAFSPKPYHVSASLLCTEDSSFIPVVKRRRLAFTAQRRPEKQERSVQAEARKKEMPEKERSHQRSWRESRVSSELRRLSQEHFPKEEMSNLRSWRESRVSSELRRLSQEDFPKEKEKEKVTAQRSAVDSKDKQNYEVVFGIAPCLLALTQGRRKAHRLFVKDGEASQRASVLQVCEAAHRRQVQIHRVSKRDLDKMSSGGVHQGVCLQASPLSYLTKDRDPAPSRGHAPLWLVLERVQDPMNLGAILRSAYFLGVDRVASSLHHSCPLSPVVSKASSGVMEVLEVYGYENLENMLRAKLGQGWQVVGTVGAGAEHPRLPVSLCSDFQMTKPTVLLMGGEGDGLSQQLLSLCQTLLTIPPGRVLSPGIESLNVSVATGILLHALLSSRRSHR